MQTGIREGHGRWLHIGLRVSQSDCSKDKHIAPERGHLPALNVRPGYAAVGIVAMIVYRVAGVILESGAYLNNG